MSKQVLGKGLGALIPTEQETSVHQDHYKQLPLAKIAPNPMQPRREFDDDRLAELAQSLKRDGVVQPLVVKKNGSGYIIIAGERRFRAASMAGLSEVPAVIMDDIDDVRLLELALIENIHREDLNPLELAEAYQRLVKQCGCTQQELSERVGKSRAVVANHLRLLTLPTSIKKLLASGKLTEGHARAILTLPSESQMLEMAEQIVANQLTVRQVEQASPRPKRRRLTVKRRNPELMEMETDLKRRLATAVRISPGLKRGKIEIDFYGHEDLDRIWNLLQKIEP